MRRREFIGLAGGAAIAWATHGRAQHDVRVRRIGFLSGVADTDPEIQSWVKEFVQGLEKLGWVNGRNVRIDTRFGDADAGAARLSTLAAELIELGPDVILAVGAPAASALRQQTLSLPIVFAAVADPVAAGFVTNLSRPEGNITGFTNFEFSVGGKWLQFLKECAPSTDRIAVLFEPAIATWAPYLRTIEAAAPSFGLRLIPPVCAMRSKLPNALPHSLAIRMVLLSYFQASLQFNIAGPLLTRQQCNICPQCIHIASSLSMAVLCPMGYDRSTFTRARRHTSTEY